MKILIRSIWILAFCFLIGCGSKLNNENFSKIEVGMTEQQVKDLIGAPTSVESSSALGMSATTYTYKKGGSEAQVVFVNGKSISKTGTFK